MPATQELVLVRERVLARTGRRVRDLSVDVVGEHIILRGLAESFHVKQLAQHGVWDLLPAAKLRNVIEVR